MKRKMGSVLSKKFEVSVTDNFGADAYRDTVGSKPKPNPVA